MRVVGLDVSLTGTGVAIVDLHECGTAPAVTVDVIGAAGVTAGKPQPFQVQQRIADLVATISGHLGDDRIDLVAIESPSLSKATGGVFERGYLWYSLILHFETNGIHLVAVSPASLKLFATGKGNASKGLIIDQIGRRWPMFETGGDNNKADAAALAALAAQLVGMPLATVPAAHLKALTALDMPPGWKS